MSNVRVGRPREERVDAALATAVRQLLVEFGYQKLTVDLIANRAGVGKPAIYRRYRSKAELIFGVVVHGRARPRPRDNGSLRADLRALVNRIHGDLSDRVSGTALPGLLSELLADPPLTERFRDTFVRTQREVVAVILDRAVSRGELPRAPAPEFAHALILGPLFVRYVILGERVPRSQLDAHVDCLVRALAPTRGLSATG